MLVDTERKPEHSDDSMIERRIAEFKTACQARGVKLTHQRMVIYRELAASFDHPDAERVYENVRRQIPTISLDTVYRTLALLADMGLVMAIGAPRERVRFDANVDIHHHFICSACGSAADVHWPEFQRLHLPADSQRAGRVDSVRVEFRGVCANCLQNQQSQTEPEEAD